MASPFSDELISAYLDGELTADEQARVEKQLREDAELRRMCEELRALRLTLQAMPTAKPSDDLAERVMRQAERRILSGDVPPTVAVGGGVQTQPLVRTAAGGWVRDWRVAAGAIATLAALVLVALWLPSHGGKEVAQAPDGSVDSQLPAASDRDSGIVAEMEAAGRGELAQEGDDDLIAVTPPDGASPLYGHADPYRSRAQVMPGASGVEFRKDTEAGPAKPNDETSKVTPGGLAGQSGMSRNAAGMMGSGAGAAGGYGGSRFGNEMGLGGGMAPAAGGSTAGQPAGPPSRRASADDNVAGKGVERESVVGEGMVPPPVPDVEPLVERFAQDKLLLVQVQVTDPVRLKAIPLDNGARRDDLPADDAVWRTLILGRVMAEIGQPMDATTYGIPSVALAESGEPLIVVEGTADQVRLSLVNLASQPGVVINSAAADVGQLRSRQLYDGRGLARDARTTPSAPGLPQKNARAQGENKEEMPSPADRGATAGTGRSDVKLRPEMQAPVAPAAQSDEKRTEDLARPAIEKVRAKSKSVDKTDGLADADESGGEGTRATVPSEDYMMRFRKLQSPRIVHILFRLKPDSLPAAQPAPAKND